MLYLLILIALLAVVRRHPGAAVVGVPLLLCALYAWKRTALTGLGVWIAAAFTFGFLRAAGDDDQRRE